MSLQKQSPDTPLFPDLLWSRPENKMQAGKLLIIGGQAGNFINVSSSYSFANEAGAGIIRLLLPDSLAKVAGNIEGAEFAPSTKSGSFGKSALAQFFDLSNWSDQVLLAGDFGKNAETTIILDGYLLRAGNGTTISQHALESIGISLEQLVDMSINLVIDRKTFQKVGIAVGTHVPITSLTTYGQMSELIADISSNIRASLVISDDEHIWCAIGGRVVSTPTKPIDLNALAAYSAVWLMQNPTKPLEAMAIAVYETIGSA